MDCAVTSPTYAIKISTILNAVAKLTDDLEYLCSVVEHPDEEFPVTSALSYARSIMAISHQLDFFTEDIVSNVLTDDEEYVKITSEEVLLLNTYNEETEVALAILEQTCGISLQNN